MYGEPVIVVAGSGPWDGPPGPARSTARRTSYATELAGHKVRNRAAYERRRLREQAGRVARTGIPEPPLEPLDPLREPPRIGGPSR